MPSITELNQGHKEGEGGNCFSDYAVMGDTEATSREARHETARERAQRTVV